MAKHKYIGAKPVYDLRDQALELLLYGIFDPREIKF
jgi:hypothetical protein